MVAVAHKMRSLTSGSFYTALTRKTLVVWIGGRLPEVVADECWSHVEVRLSILGCLTCMTYIEKVGDDVIGKEQQGRLKTIQWFKGINFFCGSFMFYFCQNLSLSTKQLCWESYSWFFLTFYCTLKTVNFWLFLLPHDWAWQMKHWRKCLYPRAPEPANCAAILGFLRKIRPCTADFWRYPSFRTR